MVTNGNVSRVRFSGGTGNVFTVAAALALDTARPFPSGY